LFEAPVAPASNAKAHSQRRRRLLYIGAGAALLGLATGVGLKWRGDATESPATARFWAQRFNLLDGRVIEAHALRGQPLLVNFWATWCPPCIEEMPLINGFYLQNKSKKHQVLGIALDKMEAVKQFVGRVPIQYPLAVSTSEGAALARELGNVSGGLPFSVFFASAGNVARRQMGRLSVSDLQAWSQFGA
jgi:thiol-disulfide isomerase/thioredoxin